MESLTAGTRPVEAALSPQGAPPAPLKPHFGKMQKVLFRKNMYLGWLRRKPLQLSTSMAFSLLPIIIVYKAVDRNVVGVVLSFMLPFYMVFAMMPVFMNMVVDILIEKESKMKEIMHIYGIDDKAYWLGWLSCYGVYSFCCSVVMGGVMAYTTDIFADSNILMIAFIFIGNYGCLMSLAFVVSVVFDKARTAAIGANVLTIVLQGLFTWINVEIPQLSKLLHPSVVFLVNLVSCLVPNYAFSKIFTKLTTGNVMQAALMEGAPRDGEGGAERRLDRVLAYGVRRLAMAASGAEPPIQARELQPLLYGGGHGLAASSSDQQLGNALGTPIQVFGRSFWHATRDGDIAYCWLFLMLIVCNLLYFFFAIWLDKRWQGEFGARQGFGCCPRGRGGSRIFPTVRTSIARRISDTNVQRLGYEAAVGNAGQPGQANGNAGGLVGSGDLTTGAHGHSTGANYHVGYQPLTDTERRYPLLLRGLTKEFPGGKVANDALSFHVASGEIFALLGHNGAGKTTLVNMLVGMLPPTSGDAFVMGSSIATSEGVQQVRAKASICPQDNPIWAEFTVRQHLEFFGTARGEDVFANIGGSGNPPNFTVVDKYAKALGIQEKLDARCSSLSGGQKRRVWVATALLGRTKLCILDEPTSGMDPQSRRDLWKLLQDMAQQEQRSIIFSTHYLEEADYLADRKVVLAQGQVKAIGTSNELKKKFGCGYWLNIVLDSGRISEAMAHKGLAMGHVADRVFARLKEEMCTHLGLDRTRGEPKSRAGRFVADSLHDSLLVPWGQVEKLGHFLEYMDAHQAALCVEDYSIEMTSLEEVFLKLGDEHEEGVADRVGVITDVPPLSADDGAAKVEDAPWGTASAEASTPASVSTATSRRSAVNAGAAAAGAQAASGDGPQLPQALLTLDRRTFSDLRQAFGMYCVRLQLFKNNKKGTFGQFIYPLLFQILFLWLKVGYAKDSNQPLVQAMGLIMCVAGLSSPLLIAFIAQIVQDKEKRIKHLVLSHGLRPASFWVGTYFSHYAILLIGFLVLPITVHLEQLTPFVDGPEAGSSPSNPKVIPDFLFPGFPVSLFILYLLAFTATGATLMWGYCVSAFFKRQEMALKFVPIFSLLSNLAPLILVTVLLVQGLMNPETEHQSTACHVGFSLVLPVYTVSGTLLYISWMMTTHGMPQLPADLALAKVLEPQAVTTVSAWFHPKNGVIMGVLGSLFQIVLYSLLLFLIEYLDYRRISLCAKRDKAAITLGGAAAQAADQEMQQQGGAPQHPFKDADVLAEERRVQSSRGGAGAEDDAICISSLFHRFKRNKPLTAASQQQALAGQGPGGEALLAAATQQGLPLATSHLRLSPCDQQLYNVDPTHLWPVNGISAGIGRGECFGLLGPNGAGKTTSLSLITGELRPPTQGTAYVRVQSGESSADSGEATKLDIRRDLTSIYGVMGIVPQFDCQWDFLTGREHVRLYARMCGTYYEDGHGGDQAGGRVARARGGAAGALAGPVDLELGDPVTVDHPPLLSPGGADPSPSRGSTSSNGNGSGNFAAHLLAAIPGLPELSYGERKIAILLHEVGLSQLDADKCAVAYSGGMRRKLSLAMTLITSPRVLYLDEPSCGVDAMAKRTLWNKIYRRPKDQTVVMTTHSMEEADALCNRVAIMVNGCLRCLGTTMHIKSVYGNGYHLELLLDISPLVDGGGPVIPASHSEQQAQQSPGQEAAPAAGSSPSRFATTMAHIPPGSGLRLAEQPQAACPSTSWLTTVDSLLIDSLARFTGSPAASFRVLEKAVFSDTRLKLVLGLEESAGGSSLHRRGASGGANTRGGDASTRPQLGKIFQWATKNQFGIIDDYSLGQPTLEQVFLKFAKQQEALTEEES